MQLTTFKYIFKKKWGRVPKMWMFRKLTLLCHLSLFVCNCVFLMLLPSLVQVTVEKQILNLIGIHLVK